MGTATLNGRTAIVTGGSRGIGLAITRMMCKNGMNVAVVSRDRIVANCALHELHDLEAISRAYVCDVSDVKQIETVVKQIAEDFGGIDVLVNCAGILDVSKIDTLTENQWDDVLATNLKGPYFMMQKTVPFLKESIAPRIVNISSNAGRMGGFENGLAYTASKGGLVALTYGAARRLAPMGITVNCVAPGTIESDMSRDNYDEAAHSRLLARFPLGRLGTPEEVAAAVCYLVSEEASFTTGAVIDVNGGMFMG